MTSVLYRSTNREVDCVDFKEALLRGQAPDKGLYVPAGYPSLDSTLIASMKDMSYAEIATCVMKPLVGDCLTEDELRAMCEDAYTFDVPIEPVENRDRRHILRLDQGPTASFKDFAAQMMGRMMQHYLKQDYKNLVILTATSGDTGSAVANAFYGKDNVQMVVLFPNDEVSDRQRKLMTTLGGNITALSVDGKFDDCQNMVKTAFSDNNLSDVPFSSANSINIGRLIPQTVYYFYAYSRCTETPDNYVIFSVPSGNFGNLTAGLIAYEMGLPNLWYIAAVNENDEFPRFLETGKYEKLKPSKKCISNAMNVGHPSNLARIVDIYEGCMDQVGNIIQTPDMEWMREDIRSRSIDDSQSRRTIKKAYENHGLLLEPHGAVGWAALEDIAPENDDNTFYVSLETAHPAKFPDEIEQLLGFEPELPESMKGLDDRPESYEEIPAEYEALKELLKQRF